MITIEIDDYKHPGNPWDCSRPKPQVEVFLEGLKQLCNKTGMHNIDIGGIQATGPFPTRLNFDDGTSVGIMRMFREIGFDYKND